VAGSKNCAGIGVSRAKVVAGDEDGDDVGGTYPSETQTVVVTSTVSVTTSHSVVQTTGGLSRLW
jgi:beta-lactam-binding protein with PASTA domain